jgi:hypothetical protein
MRIDNHLPGCFENRSGPEALPVGNIERSIHLGEAPVAFHDEGWSRFVHLKLFALLYLSLPRRHAQGAAERSCYSGTFGLSDILAQADFP